MRLPLRPAPAPTEFVGSSYDDLVAFPDEVKRVIGFALFLAQIGGKHLDAKPLRGDRKFTGAGVLEVVSNFDGDTYRAVYTVRFAGVIYVLHCFQKKSKTGISTPQKDIETIKRRLARATDHYDRHYRERPFKPSPT